ncbi:MAG TPA: polysaccharide deacetylase family protein [Bryobacteraceae bacterium]|nr:polysaccharide deacetylase family protein [Bryobacteraceae bacterium]
MYSRAAKSVFHHVGGPAFARWLHRAQLRILMYHRFSDRAALASQCAHIRRHYQPVSMAEVSEWLHARRSLPPYALAVTVDDGYRDFQEAGYPLFAEYGIPVTVFLVTDFLDGKTWLWFDRIVHAFRQTRLSNASIEPPRGQALHFTLDCDAVRRMQGQMMANRAVNWSPADRAKLLRDLPSILQTEIPEQPPADYQPLSWDAVRALAASGVEFGAHTRTHAILSAISDSQELHDEISGSKARIEAELNQPVLHFCYPNGNMRDIGPAAVKAVREAGMLTAVTAQPGLNQPRQDPFLLRRIGVDPGHETMYFERSLAGLRLP